MAGPIDYRRLTKEQFPDTPGWALQLFDSLNAFNQQVQSALNRNLTFGENVLSQIYTSTVNTPSDYNVGGFNTIDLNWSFIKRVDGVILLSITNTDGSTITTGTNIDWTQRSQNVLRINYIAGLANSMKYTVKLLVI